MLYTIGCSHYCGVAGAGVVVAGGGELVVGLGNVWTRSSIRSAASTQACVDSSPLHATRSRVSPLRRTKRAPRPDLSSSSSRMARLCHSLRSEPLRSAFLSVSQRSRLPCHCPDRLSYPSSRDELWLH